MKSANKIVPLAAASPRRGRHELAFLPAALEILDTPPSPTGRAIAGVIALLFCLAIAWAALGKVDVIASAPGKMIPSGRSKVIQPFETGVIRAIHVRDGQMVKAGDVLIELDPTIDGAERDHLRSDLLAARLEITRLHAALSSDPDPLGQFDPPEGAPADLVQMQRQYLAKQIEEHRAKLASLDGQRAQKQSERDTIGAMIDKLNATIPVIKERLEVRKILYDKELGSKLSYLETLQQLVDEQQDLVVDGSRYKEAEAALAAITETHREADAEYSRALLAELADAERKAAGLAEDLIKAEQRMRLQVLTTPIDGYVQQLAVHTVGGVVTPAQSLLVVVPTESHLEIEAVVSNRDIGFVKPGQTAAIKVDTFNFTRYGLLRGKVLGVSHDSMLPEKMQDKATSATPDAAASSEPRSQGLIYVARVSLDKNQMRIDDNLVELSPGMAVTVEIKTGSRTPLEYLLSPLLRYGHDSLRER